MGAPKGGPEGWGAQHFALFFRLPLPPGEPRRLAGRRGFTKWPWEPKRAFCVEFGLEPRPEREARMKIVATEGNKERKFGRSR